MAHTEWLPGVYITNDKLEVMGFDHGCCINLASVHAQDLTQDSAVATDQPVTVLRVEKTSDSTEKT